MMRYITGLMLKGFVLIQVLLPQAHAAYIDRLDLDFTSSIMNDASITQEVLLNNSLVPIGMGTLSLNLSPGDVVKIHFQGMSQGSPSGIGAASGSVALGLFLTEGVSTGRQFSVNFSGKVS